MSAVDKQGNLLSHPMVRPCGVGETNDETYLAVARLGLMSAFSVGVIVPRQVVKSVELHLPRDLREVQMTKMKEITIIY